MEEKAKSKTLAKVACNQMDGRIIGRMFQIWPDYPPPSQKWLRTQVACNQMVGQIFGRIFHPRPDYLPPPPQFQTKNSWDSNSALAGCLAGLFSARPDYPAQVSANGHISGGAINTPPHLQASVAISSSEFIYTIEIGRAHV